MLRPSMRALLALLLARPLRAQVVRVVPTLAPSYGAPALTGFGSPLALSPLGLSPLSAPSLAVSLSVPALTPAPALQAAPVSLAALEVVIPAAAKADRPNDAPGRAQTPVKAATPADGWASRFNFRMPATAGAQSAELFDGERPLKDE